MSYQAYHEGWITLEERTQLERLNQVVARAHYRRWRAEQQQALEEIGPYVKALIASAFHLSVGGKHVDWEKISSAMGFSSFIHLSHHLYLVQSGVRS